MSQQIWQNGLAVACVAAMVGLGTQSVQAGELAVPVRTTVHTIPVSVNPAVLNSDVTVRPVHWGYYGGPRVSFGIGYGFRRPYYGGAYYAPGYYAPVHRPYQWGYRSGWRGYGYYPHRVAHGRYYGCRCW